MATQVYLKPAERSAWNLDGMPKTADGKRQLHMWNILRGPNGRQGLTAADLALLASTEELPIRPAQAQRYLEALLGRNVVLRTGSDHWYLRGGLASSPEPALLLGVRFLYVPRRSIGSERFDAVEVPL